MKRPMQRQRRLKPIFHPALALFAVVLSLPAIAQQLDCAGLQAQIASASQPTGNAGRYLAAANKQRGEIARTQAYAQSLGCDRRQFLFFGSPPPAQCGPLEQRIASMQANLGTLQAQVQASSGGGRPDLVARYNAWCRGGQQQSAVLQPRSLFEQLFGSPQQYERLPINPDDIDPEENKQRGGSTAICVRTCDGGFFPVSYGAGRRDLDEFADLCKALCPNAETAVYRFTNGGDIENAVNSSGDSYTQLPNAGKFKKAYDPTCTCKPPGQTWAESLEQAEKLLGSRRRDLIVTPEKAEELSRPRARQEAARVQPVVQQGPDAEQQDAAIGASAPTASTQSSGIEGDRATSGRAYGVTDGVSQDTKDASGNKRRVRVIGPTL